MAYTINPHTDFPDYYKSEAELTPTFVLKSGDTMAGFLFLHADPTDEYHATTKKYVDQVVTALSARYYALDTADTGGTAYKLTSLTASAGATATVTEAGLVNDQYIMGWISPVGVTFSKMIAGVYDFNIFAEKTAGTKILRIYWELVEYKADTTETVIATSNVGNIITAKERQGLYATLSEDYYPAADSRIVGKIYASVTGGGSAPTCVLYYEGDEDSHWEIPTNTEILNDIYVNVDGDTMTGALKVTTTGSQFGNNDPLGTVAYVDFGEIDIAGEIIPCIVPYSNSALGDGTLGLTSILHLYGGVGGVLPRAKLAFVDFETPAATNIEYQGETDTMLFYSHAMMNVATNFYFRDTDISIRSNDDSYLDFYVDGGFRFHTGDIVASDGGVEVSQGNNFTLNTGVGSTYLQDNGSEFVFGNAYDTFLFNGVASSDVVFQFSDSGTTSTGQLTWCVSEELFVFNDIVAIGAADDEGYIYFVDENVYIYGESSNLQLYALSELDIYADYWVYIWSPQYIDLECVKDLSIATNGGCLTLGAWNDTEWGWGIDIAGVPAVWIYGRDLVDISTAYDQIHLDAPFINMESSGTIEMTAPSGIFMSSPSGVIVDGVVYCTSCVEDTSTLLKLDQTSPQTVENGSPIFDGGIVVNDVIKVDNDSGLEFQNLESVWAFKYLDSVLANSGVYFNTGTGSIEFKYLNVSAFICNVTNGNTTIGNGGEDVSLTFNGSADGVLTWMEDEDYFKFYDDILINSTERIYFGDTGTYIYNDGADLVIGDTGSGRIKIDNSVESFGVGYIFGYSDYFMLSGSGAYGDGTSIWLPNTPGGAFYVGYGAAAGSIHFGESGANLIVPLSGADPITTGNVLQVPNGAVGKPAYSFNGATTTGMYRDGGYIYFSVAGAQILSMLSTGLTIGASADTFLRFAPTGTNQGELYWMEDEDYFKIMDNVLINSAGYIYFNDTGSYIQDNGTRLLLSTDDVNEKIGIVTNSDVVYVGAYPSGGWMSFGGAIAGVTDDNGLQIYIPTVATNGFFYGYGGNEVHNFGSGINGTLILNYGGNKHILMPASAKIYFAGAENMYIGHGGAGNLNIQTSGKFNFSTSTADTDLEFNFTGTTNDGQMFWMEDEDYFQYMDDVLINSAEQLYFRDTAIYINSADDGHLDLTADVQIDLNAVTLITDKLEFTQIDGNEYIDSLNDGYMDYGATTAHRFNNAIIVNDGATYSSTTNGLGVASETNCFITAQRGANLANVGFAWGEVGQTDSWDLYMTASSNNLQLNNISTAQIIIEFYSATDEVRVAKNFVVGSKFLNGNDPYIQFGETTAGLLTNKGFLYWMEDEDYFKFSDDILINSTEQLYFRDTALTIYSSADGQLDIDADTEVEITAPTVDINASSGVDISNDLTVAGAVYLDNANIKINAPNAFDLYETAPSGIYLVAPSGVSVSNDLQVNGELLGCRSYLYSGKQAAMSASAYATAGIGGTVVMSSLLGFAAMRSGSITGIDSSMNITLCTTPGDITFQARVNDSPVFTQVVPVTTTGALRYIPAIQARGTDKFVAGDLLTMYVEFTTFVGTIGAGLILTEEIVYDT